MLSYELLAVSATMKDTKVWLCVAVAAIAYLVVDKMLAMKHNLDSSQFKAAQAGGVAAATGFKMFDDLLFWCGAGNIKEIRNLIKELWKKYCQDERGPIRLARDVFIATWAKLRVDKEYGNEVRQLVVSEALGLEISDKMDVEMARAADRASRIGWSKLGKAGLHMAGREWMQFSTDIRSVFDEFMEPDGEKKIAARVMDQTFDVLWNDPKFRPQAEALVKKYAAKVGTPAT